LNRREKEGLEEERKRGREEERTEGKEEEETARRTPGGVHTPWS